MCGIFGVIADQAFDFERALACAVRSLHHRGPDDQGMEILQSPTDPGTAVGFAATRLAVLDLSPAGHQPMADPDTGCRLVYNGEIFNFKEIRRELEGHGFRFQSQGDTEVLLKAYVRWGVECLTRLRGMFAFAVWDPRSGRLLVARDRLGVKPVYFVASAGLFAFSSEVRALLKTEVAPRRLNKAGLVSYLGFGAVQSPWTIIEGVRELPPGRALTWQNGKLEERKYWSLREAAAGEPATGDALKAAARVREILGEAVAQALVSDVPTALFLSGGVDSSAIAALASEASPRAPATFSVVFSERAYSEALYADLVARRFRTEHTRVELRPVDLLEAMPQAFGAQDQPSIDGLNSFVVCLAAKRAGMTVGLSGLGGDELFAGYAGFRTVPKMLWLEEWARARKIWKERGSASARMELGRKGKVKAWLRGGSPGEHPYFLTRLLFLLSAIQQLTAGLASCEEFWEGFAQGLPQVARLDPVNQVSVLEAATYMPSMLLRDTDAMSMGNSLEVRVPLTDHKLWEYVLPLEGAMKVDRHIQKPLLVRALGSLLPEGLGGRRKMGFALPMDPWLRGPLRATVEQQLRNGAWRDILPLNQRAIWDVWNAFLKGRTSWSRPWSLYTLTKWAERNLGEAA